MCGIIGYYSETPKASDYQKIARLFEQSKIRGIHSFGISFIHPSSLELITEKYQRIDELSEALLAIGGWGVPPKLLIGHNRYSTSGDWRDAKNNQPLHLNPGALSEMSLAFNGVIDMRDPAEWGDIYNAEFQTRNDGEIFIDHYIKNGDPVEFVRRPKISFAGVFIHNGVGYVLRNRNRPAWLCLEGQAVFISSTSDIIARAIGKAESSRELKPFRLISFPHALRKMIEIQGVA